MFTMTYGIGHYPQMLFIRFLQADIKYGLQYFTLKTTVGGSERLRPINSGQDLAAVKARHRGLTQGIAVLAYI